MKMKLLVSLAGLSAAFAASWSSASEDARMAAGRAEDVAGCISHAKKFITNPVRKATAIERAMDHCALDKKLDDRNFVCPHYRELLEEAFRREHSMKEFGAQSFCDVAETYMQQLKSAARIPNMGKGSGLKFKVAKDCKLIVAASFAPAKKLKAENAPDFWYALCMNQDCAHFLPSRTRWCTEDHQPTHSAAVCEAMRLYSRDEVTVIGDKELDAEEVCGIYDEFVENAYINVEAYLHVVHGKKKHPVPTPGDKDRALQSARMKNEAGKHKLRDSAGDPVKSAASNLHIVVGLVTSLVVYIA